MAMIKRLSLQGVRSFSPEDSKGQWIEFGSPLTLIVGINGSGKTTIIESLKYAITSQFPPNSSKGSGFVNDPRLTYNDSALAKVTLELMDGHSNKYVTSRKVKVQVTSGKGDRSMSQLEATLRKTDIKGDTKQLTTKCNDIKVEMCRIMGVSEAILNYVVFCHQEESCWPLDEAKKVKETFDAIFNTTAYKKCFDQLTKIEKELGTQVKIEEEGLKYVRDNRQLAVRYKENLEDKRIQLQSHNDAMKEYENDVSQMEKKLDEYRALEMEYSKKYEDVFGKKKELETLGVQIDELRGNIKEEYQGSMAELEESLRNFTQECMEKKKEIKKLENEHRENETEWKKHDSLKGGLLKEEGMFLQEENANKKRVEELESVMAEAVAALKSLKDVIPENVMSASFSSYVDACDSESGRLSYEAVSKALASAMRMKDDELLNVKTGFEKQEKELQKGIDELRAKMVSMEKEKDLKRKQLEDGQSSFEELKRRLASLEGSNEKLKLLDDDEQTLVEDIEAIEKSGFMLKCDSEITALAAEVKSFDSKMSTVSATVKLLTSDKSKTDLITHVNRQKLQKENECKEIMRKMKDDIKQVLGEVPEVGLGKEFDAKLSSLNSDLKAKKSELKKNETALNFAKSEVKYLTNDLKKLETKLKDFKSQVADVLEDKDYNTAYDEMASELDKTQADLSYEHAASFLYKKYISKLKKKDCCPLCKRDFEAREMANKLAKDIEGEITRMVGNLPQLQAKVEKLKQEQQQVLGVKPLWDEIQRLTEKDIPSLKTKKAEAEEKLEKLTDENEALGLFLSAIETDVGIANKCRSQVAVYEQCQKEIKKYDDEISKAERSRDPEAKKCSTTLTDAETELLELKLALDSKRSEKENKEDIRNKKRNELAKLQERKNKVKEEKLKITAELQNREALEEQKKDLETSTKELQGQIKELTQRIPTVRVEIVNAEKQKFAFTQKRDKALQKLREEKSEFEKRKTSINDKQKYISEFEKKKGKFAMIQQRVAECKEKLSVCEQRRKEIVQTMDKLKKDVASHELKERELEDNRSLKKKLEQMSKLKIEVKEKEKMLNQAENRSLSAEKRKLQDRHREVEARLNELKGKQIEMKNSIRELEKQLKDPMFANAEKEFIQRLAKKISYTKSQKDVRAYKTALDIAIMQFHKKRMERINKILFEYWRRIYKGNDIDKIMIKTETEKDPSDATTAKSKNKVKASTASTRKAYNYRVVMVRRGVEIDMRGRCSAGQRVLASIIIRIALAESFGARCGIICLDEPTTNLDQRNINSLADALADLADKMSTRKNFQLIVITHDQDFTERLMGVDAVEKYWKVDRDNDGFSQIRMVLKRGIDDR